MNQTRRINLWTSITLVLLASLVLPWTAFAAVWTDKLDYSPGETVTILGDNSDGSGYLPGETVHVDVVGPNGYTAMCDGVAADDSNAAWSCQVVLWDSDLAYGTYYYTATGLTSGVVEEGSFTDAIKIGSYLPDCNTQSDSFILGDQVCAKAYGLARNATGAIKWWAPGLDVNSDEATSTTSFGPISGNATDQYVPAACGTWTLKVYSPATTYRASATFLVTQPPSALFSWSPEPQDEGSPVQFTDESIDCDGPIAAWSWDFGGVGTSSEQNPSFTFLDNGIYNVCLTVTDSTGDTDQVCHEVTVLNVAPEVTIQSPADLAVFDIASGVSVAYSWFDPGVLDTFVCTVEWGDGTVETLDDCTSPQTTAIHDYSSVGAGLWPITVTVMDDDCGQGEAAIIVVVYDPDAGFVTGGGWINSPEGAYAPNPTLTGMATFGFVSKYHKGATVPVGETEFQFHVAGLNFHSESYEWLIVNQAGTNAQYKGVGAINGIGGYSFMLWGTDGDVDAFRIKIWEGEDTIVYDNGFNQPIASGTIIVHTGKK